MVNSVSVIGLGKLGSPMLACFASKGFNVIGVDVIPNVVDAINEGRSPVYEPDLQERLTSARGNYHAMTDIRAAILQTNVTFLIVPTPSDANGTFSLRYVLPVCESIGAALREKDDFHLVVLTSTVMPGATGSEVKSALEQASGKRCGIDFGLCYSPEFIALGSVIRDFLNPDFVLIGESDARSGEMLADIYQRVCDNQPSVSRMSFVNAELAKISVNTYVTTKISFANMLARICEHLPDADVDVVTDALGKDSRIGAKYLKGAIGYGGPCFPRDNVALAALARNVGISAPLAEATDQFNRHSIVVLAELVKVKLGANRTVGILGLSYKPNTDVIEESPGVMLAQTLATDGVNVIVYDPAALNNARRMLGENVQFADTLDAALHAADVLVIATPWPEFRQLMPQQLDKVSVVIDCWRILDRERFGAVTDYVPLGIGNKQPVQIS